ncbi:MAG: hypothetical protein QOE61_5123 [Micromonosporaceae bacterium]|nr:hypothetical protein [Micromonosporaceae bacterium]
MTDDPAVPIDPQHSPEAPTSVNQPVPDAEGHPTPGPETPGSQTPGPEVHPAPGPQTPGPQPRVADLGDAGKLAEGTLYDDPATADLGAKVNEAWADFGKALAEALPALPAGCTLDLTLDPNASGVGEAMYSVSVEPVGTAELRAYAVSNALLPPEHRLSRTAVADLVALGWSPPGVVGEDDERFGVRLPTAQASRLAAILSRTVRDVYGTPHPAFLMYTMDSVGDQPPVMPQLGAARPVPGGGQDLGVPGRTALEAMPLPDKVTSVIAAMLNTTPENLPLDNDGDIGIRSGSAMVFVRVRDNPPLVDVFSPVLTDVDANQQLYVKLSELTHRMPIGRLYCTNNTVWASVPVFGRDFQATHLMLAVQVMTGLADELDDRLHGEFGGKRFFADGDKPEGDPKDDKHTGMYL